MVTDNTVIATVVATEASLTKAIATVVATEAPLTKAIATVEATEAIASVAPMVRCVGQARNESQSCNKLHFVLQYIVFYI